MSEVEGTADVGVEVGGDHVAAVEIRRPPNNFFDAGLIRRLADALDRLASGDDGDVRAVVLCSEGRHFCAGANFGGGGRGEGDARDLYQQAVRLFRQPLPVVAAVQGAAVGGGLGLALAADLRVAAPEARFSANFARLGFHQGFGLSVTLPRAVGPQAAFELMTTGRRIGGEEAHRLGLVDRLAPVDGLRDAARALAAEIAGSAPLAVRSIRATLRAGLADEVAEAVVHERAEQERLMRTADFREGLAAVAERRPGNFTGR
ncbi:MAG TPA: enoyl-CoA hydratase/isomerase family protein [Acidimicrobiales bacterium]|nr:enoyl-CoA hydratase/isomerase family protein [Acidimicrobiales bacterium]